MKEAEFNKAWPCVAYLSAGRPFAAEKIRWQRRSVRQFARERGYRIVRTFADVNPSTDPYRSNLRKAVMTATSGDIHALLVSSLENLCRSMRDLLELEHQLQDADVALISAQALSVPPIELDRP